MPMAGRANVTESLKTILICVESYEDSLLKGMLYHNSFAGCKRFDNLMQMIAAIENILENTGFPKATMEKRRFHAFNALNLEPEAVSAGSFQAPKGEKATFKLKIMFRQNASWQGSVAWVEGNSEEPFRSALEFVMLVDSALS